MLKAISSRLISQSGVLYLRATSLCSYQLPGTKWSASKTSDRRYTSRIAKTSATLEEKRRHAELGGGQKRIDKQHATVSLFDINNIERQETWLYVHYV